MRSLTPDYLDKYIKLPRVKIKKRKKDCIRVSYNGSQFDIIESDETCFYSAGGTGYFGAHARVGVGIRVLVVRRDMVFFDRKAPADFLEIMIFHELREMEYLDAGLSDPHDRAVCDETLYALKYFPGREAQYFEFANQSRLAAQEAARQAAQKAAKEAANEKRQQKRAERAQAQILADNRQKFAALGDCGFTVEGNEAYQIHIGKRIQQANIPLVCLRFETIHDNFYFELAGAFIYRIQSAQSAAQPVLISMTGSPESSTIKITSQVYAFLEENASCRLWAYPKYVFRLGQDLEGAMKIYQAVLEMYRQELEAVLFSESAP